MYFIKAYFNLKSFYFVYLYFSLTTPKIIKPLTALDLEVLKSVRIITGYVMIDGGKQNNSKIPTSLSFLENLEIIEGLF